MYLNVLLQIFNLVYLSKKHKSEADPDVIRTRNLLIWSQTRYRCATESYLKTIHLEGSHETFFA